MLEETPVKKKVVKVVTRKSKKSADKFSNLTEENVKLYEEMVKCQDSFENKVSEKSFLQSTIEPDLRLESKITTFPDKNIKNNFEESLSEFEKSFSEFVPTIQTNDETSSIFTLSKITLKPYQKEGRIEAGLDEAGRGCFLGRVYTAAVILPNNILEIMEKNKIKIRDSKKLSKKVRQKAREFIEKNAAYAKIDA